MTHDPMCHSLTEAEGLDVYYNGPVGGSDHIECITCYYIAMVRADEHSRHDGCLCERSVTEFWQDGALQWVFIDGRKFVPQETL